MRNWSLKWYARSTDVFYAQVRRYKRFQKWVSTETKIGVADTGLDLIRHGRNERDKHNKDVTYESDELETPSPVHPPAKSSHKDPMADMLSHVPKRMDFKHEEERKKHAVAQQQKEQREKNRAEEYAREAEMIVEQEKKERSKMVGLFEN